MPFMGCIYGIRSKLSRTYPENLFPNILLPLLVHTFTLFFSLGAPPPRPPKQSALRPPRLADLYTKSYMNQGGRRPTTWLLRKCFPILQSYWGGCRHPRPPRIKLGGRQTPPHFLGGRAAALPPRPPHPRIMRGFAPQTPPQEIGKTIGAGLY